MNGTVWVLVLVFSTAALTFGLTVRDIWRCRSHPSRTPGPAPEGGWFGTDVQWPTQDPDVNAAVHYLRNSGLPDGPDTEDLLERVLDGVRRIGMPG